MKMEKITSWRLHTLNSLGWLNQKQGEWMNEWTQILQKKTMDSLALMGG
jgi:hypothetical protein